MIRLILCFMLLPVLAFADGNSTAIIAKLSSLFGGYKNYEVQFTAKVDDGAGSVPGRYVVSGDRYYITVEDRQVYSDGKQKYEVNDTDREVTIDVINPKDKDLLSNPTRAFEFVDGSYTHTYKGETTYAGKKCAVVVLKPVAVGAPIQEITLMVDATSGQPVGVRYRIEGVTSPVEVTVRKITQLPSVSQSMFTFDKNRHKGYEIIDFR